MGRELRVALGVMGALVVIGVAISLALQPELVWPPGGGGADWRAVVFLVAAVALGAAGIVQGVVALAEWVGKRREGPVTQPGVEVSQEVGSVASGGMVIGVQHIHQPPAALPFTPLHTLRTPAGQMDARDLESLRRQLGEMEESLRLIEERKAEYVLGVDVPLTLVKEEGKLRKRIAAMREKIQGAEGDSSLSPVAAGAALRAQNDKSAIADARSEGAPFLRDVQPRPPFADRGCIRDPRRFFNRQRLVRELSQMLAAGNSVSLVGESQIGKSSLLYYLHVTRAEWLPAGETLYLDLQGVLDEAHFCAEVLEGLGEAAGDLRALKRALRRRTVALLMDEVERLADPAFSPRLQDVLRSLAQEPALTLGVASQRPLAQVFPPSSETSPLHNIFTEKRVGPFTSDEARGLLARVNGSGVRFTPEEIEGLVAASAGHPARLQELASALYAAKTGG